MVFQLQRAATGDDLSYSKANAVPSLDLRFSTTKTLNDYITGTNLVTFTRASTGTFVGADGTIQTAAVDAPRFDHSPTTGESLGLLVEEARTNLWQWSNSATDGQTWSNVGTHLTLTAGQTSPAGDSTAIRAADVDNATAGTFLQRTTVAPALTANTFVSYSIFIKPINIPNTIGVAIFANGTTDGVTGTFTVSGSAITGSSINYNGTGASGSASHVAYPNGWYRVTVSGIPSTVTMADCRVRINLGSYTRSTGTARFDWYGGQFENNAFASSYFPNAGTLGGVTRAADVASITGSNFSSFYNQTEGTMFASGDFVALGPNGFSRIVGLAGANTGIDEISFYTRVAVGTGDGSIYGAVTVNSSLEGDLDAPPGTPNFSGGYRSALAYKANNFGLATNGLSPTVDTSGSLPTITQLIIMGSIRFQNRLSGHVRRLTYWPVRLQNNTLQAITQS